MGGISTFIGYLKSRSTAGKNNINRIEDLFPSHRYDIFINTVKDSCLKIFNHFIINSILTGLVRLAVKIIPDKIIYFDNSTIFSLPISLSLCRILKMIEINGYSSLFYNKIIFFIDFIPKCLQIGEEWANFNLYNKKLKLSKLGARSFLMECNELPADVNGIIAGYLRPQGVNI